MVTDRRPFCTFFLDDFCLGVEVARVQEVLRMQPLTRVPLAPPAVRGLINLRGQIVTAIDLRPRLGLAERPAGMLPMNLVVRGDDGTPVSFLVDEIGEVIEVGEDQMERPPETLTGARRELIRGAYKLDHGLLLALDCERAMCLTDTPGLPRRALSDESEWPAGRPPGPA